MKKEDPIKETFHAFLIGIAVIILIVIFSTFGKCSVDKNNKTKEPLTYEDNCQLNEMEQYHRSQGRNIKFTDDILP